MSKAQRIRQQNAREKIAQQRAAERRAQVRRQILLAGGSILAVLVIVVVFVIIKATGGSDSGSSTSTANASVVRQITSVPASTLTKVGAGTANPKMLISVPSTTALTANGKPEMLYMGAEYCPFCATERWAMTQALSRFGTFSGLSFIHSSSSDQPASIPTLTFYKSKYTSKYLTFTPVEMQKVDRSPLQTPTKAQNALLQKYDNAPYIPSGDAGSIPFVDLGNKFIVSGASYDYTVLQGQSYAQIGSALQDPSSPIAKGAIGAANYFTAGICKLTGDQPATACTASIKSIEAGL
jgi:hypothetical protein